MFADKVKIYGVPIINPSLSLLMKHLVIGQRQVVPDFSAFLWSLQGRLVSISQQFVTTTVVHLTTRTETSLFTETDLSGPNHRIGPCISEVAGFIFFIISKRSHEISFIAKKKVRLRGAQLVPITWYQI